jgi:hypothetical protein
LLLASAEACAAGNLGRYLQPGWLPVFPQSTQPIEQQAPSLLLLEHVQNDIFVGFGHGLRDGKNCPDTSTFRGAAHKSLEPWKTARIWSGSFMDQTSIGADRVAA